jgi:hypothetical protein
MDGCAAGRVDVDPIAVQYRSGRISIALSDRRPEKGSHHVTLSGVTNRDLPEQIDRDL